jgi:hypothetical protein
MPQTTGPRWARLALRIVMTAKDSIISVLGERALLLPRKLADLQPTSA